MHPSQLTTRLLHRSLLGFALGMLLPSLVGIGECNKPCSSDVDSDGVCDDEDLCPYGDDAIDTDSDTIPDACDICPADASNDLDNDGVCDSVSSVSFTSPPPRNKAILQRNNTGSYPLVIAGTIKSTGYDTAVLQISKNGTLWKTVSYPVSPTTSNAAFTLSAELPAGLVAYTLRLSLKKSGVETEVFVRTDVAVGDLILIQGQSNAVAGDYWGEHKANLLQSSWIRSFGTASVYGDETAQDLVWDTADGEGIHAHATVGTWGLYLASKISQAQGVPVGILNGAVGGTLISQHLRNDLNPEDLNTIYGRFLYRARKSDMADSARYIVWYQGESDGIGYGVTSNAYAYPDRFDTLRSSWKNDFKGLERIYVFQVHNGCGIDSPRNAALYLNFYDSSFNQLSYDRYEFQANTTWRDFPLAVKAPANTSVVGAFLLTYGSGAIDFDDASLIDSSALSLLKNGGFESGTTLPSDWSYYEGGAYTWTTGSAHGGTRALRLDSSAAFSMVGQAASATSGKTYSATVWAAPVITDPYMDVREMLRRLPAQYPDVTVLSTNGAPGHDSCHYYYDGYRELGDRVTRVVKADFYGSTDTEQINPPDVESITWLSATSLRLTVSDPEQQLTFEAGAEDEFFIDGARVIAGTASGHELTLTLDRATTATSLSYLSHMYDGPDILNARGIGMLAFYEMPIQ